MEDPTKYKDLCYTKTTPSGQVNGDSVTYSSRLILQAADALGVTWKILPNTKIVELTYQDEVKYYRFQISTETTDVGFYSCLDKSVTSALLETAGISIPKGFRLAQTDTPEYWMEVFEALPKPVVVKPTHGNQGRNITMNISDPEKYKVAVEKAFSFTNDQESGVVVETQFEGKEYRITSSREKVLGITYRMPANVVGDGIKNIKELVDEKNSDPRRSPNPNDSLVTIKFDDSMMEYLKDQNLDLNSIPAKDERVFVRRNSNISTGGDSIDMTDLVHPSVKEIAVKAVNALPGLDFAGVDFMSPNIEGPQTPETYRIIEINSSPGFSIHQMPYQGTPRDLASEFLYIAFPSLRPTA